jgi:hypothetical protein
MKKKILFIITAVLLVITSCKKNKEETKDIKTLFSNTTWTGEAKYTARSVAEPFCVKFDATGTFMWYELDGDYIGTYTVNNDSKTVVFTFGGGSKVTGTVTNNSKLTNFQYGSAYPWVINTMELYKGVIPELTGTRWTGKSELEPIIVNFKPLSKVDYAHSTAGFRDAAYLVKDGSVRFNPSPNRKFFGVIKNKDITGIEKHIVLGFPSLTFYQKWQVTNQ